MIKRFNSTQARLRRHQRMRRHLEGSQMRPRLNVFRSGQNIYAQIIDDATGRTLVAASSLDEGLRDFKSSIPLQERVGNTHQTVTEKVADVVEMSTEALPIGKGKGAKTEKAVPKQQAKGGQPQKGGKPGSQAKMVLPQAQKGARKTPVEALEGIKYNRKVAVAREVGKLVARRAKEEGITRVVFDRGGYAFHGRVAALAEGAREIGLDF
jgi:ribosomal protein L18